MLAGIEEDGRAAPRQSENDFGETAVEDGVADVSAMQSGPDTGQGSRRADSKKLSSNSEDWDDDESENARRMPHAAWEVTPCSDARVQVLVSCMGSLQAQL